MKATIIGRAVAGMALAAMTALTAEAAILFAKFTDATGDESVRGDVLGAIITVDTTAGTMNITWSSTAANPFSGDGDATTDDLRLNLNIGNTRLGTFITAQQIFSDVTSTTSLSYTDSSPSLTNWLVGDTIVTFGDDPPFATGFGSSLIPQNAGAGPVRDQLETSDVLSTTEPTPFDPGVVDPPSDVPAPASLAVLGAALAGLGTMRRRMRDA